MIRPIHNGVTYPYRFLLILVFSIQPVVGAFEGAHFFRVFLPQPDGLAPPAWNNPALLSRESYWLAAGRGQPLDYEWATYHTLSIGSSWKGNNLSGSLWTSGDSLYRETASGLTVSKSFNPTMRAGLSLTWNRVSISGEDKPQQEISLGAALDREIHPGMAASVWYSGITLAPHLAPTLTRPIVQLCLHSTGEQNLDWAFYVEKTAGYPLEGIAETQLFIKKQIALQLGYRTQTGMPFGGVRFEFNHLSISARFLHHQVFGLASGFAVALK